MGAAVEVLSTFVSWLMKSFCFAVLGFFLAAATSRSRYAWACACFKACFSLRVFNGEKN